MTEQPLHRRTNETISEVIAQYPAEFGRDAVGVWQIVPGGRANFGLSGDALTSYLRRAILELLAAGAVPVKGAPDSGYFWIAQKQYGTTPEEIADAVIAEWQSVADDPMILIGECAWFAKPRPDNDRYVKVD